MTNDDKWLVAGGPAVLLRYTYLVGVGGYWTPERVSIHSVAATQVRVVDAAGEMHRIRRADMTAPRTAGRYGRDHVLVPVGDLRARRAANERAVAERVGRITAALDDIRKTLVTSDVRVAADVRAAVGVNLSALDRMASEIDVARRDLSAMRDVIG